MRAVFSRLLKYTVGRGSGESPAISDEASQRTQFLDVQRRIRIYLRAMWGCEFILKQTDVDLAEDEARLPFVEDGIIHLPSALADYAVDGATRATGLELYRAAAAHAAAHLIHTQEPLPPKGLDRFQIAVISAIEDARVEALAIRSFPGLQRLWGKLHTATPADATAGGYLQRLARALLDQDYVDDDPWIVQARGLFAAAELEDAGIARGIGLRLADSFREKRIRAVVGDEAPGSAYRDDNRLLWQHRGKPLEIVNPYLSSHVIARDGKPVEPSKKKRKPRIKLQDEQADAATYFYPEWNYRSQTSDPGWVTLREADPQPGELRVVERILDENHHLVVRMRKLLRGIRDGAVHRVRKLEEGDELDINAAVRAQIDVRLGLQPDARIMMRTERKNRDISVLMLMDFSGSMKNKVQGHEHTALELTQQLGVLFADAIEAAGDPFAIHGFSSASRHNVEYYRLKDFDQHYDDAPKARIAGMATQLGTRMGAAIRHATHLLNKQKSSKKLLLVISDGAPSDVDVTDRHYLHNDAKKAVEDASRNGIHTYCINFDPGADRYVSRIFGARNYMVVDHVRHLPEKILLLYAALTR